ncbi:hypothetical protein HPP92_007814 [Vanilla planifolia]|uniref:Uncharacterized protein n=1 Tax=Vanilla planifolia TaxID=51239 RepID=A0A835RMQ1_VANPL|nr:hypothetical protein HPP92_007814 [Vanilla planifolia]
MDACRSLMEEQGARKGRKQANILPESSLPRGRPAKNMNLGRNGRLRSISAASGRGLSRRDWMPKTQGNRDRDLQGHQHGTNWEAEEAKTEQADGNREDGGCKVDGCIKS